MARGLAAERGAGKGAGVDTGERRRNARVKMLRAFALALAQLADPRVLRIWLKSLGVTLLVFAALGTMLWWGATWALDRSAPGELGQIAAALLTILVLLLGWRIIALAVLQLFADEVVQAVEARHYPAMAASARKLGWHEELANGLKGAGRAVLFNLLALPLALLLLMTGVGAPLVFLAVNAVLLGRELQDMVWLRHRTAFNERPPLSGLERLVLGGITALLLTVPIANLVAAFLGAAATAHLIHRKGIAAHAA